MSGEDVDWGEVLVEDLPSLVAIGRPTTHQLHKTYHLHILLYTQTDSDDWQTKLKCKKRYLAYINT